METLSIAFLLLAVVAFCSTTGGLFQDGMGYRQIASPHKKA